MPDPVRLIVKRLTAMTYQIVDGRQQFVWGTVLSRNPDGSVNMDDGKGGCVLVYPPVNARVGDRVLVNLGAIMGGIGMPGVLSPSASVPQINHAPPTVFIDNTGRVFNDVTGALKAASGGTPTADVDASFGYSFSADPFAGASPGYADLQIGVAGVSGYQGETYSANNTVLCQGAGVSSGVLCGIETDNVTSLVWTVQLRDASTFAILATNAATYISDWMTAHAADYFGDDTSWDVHVSADPIDGSFWINLGGNVGPDSAPMFNVDAADGSLIRTVTIDLSADHSFFKRVHRVSQ